MVFVTHQNQSFLSLNLIYSSWWRSCVLI